MIRKRKALSLVEISIGVVISALLLSGIMKLFSSGMKGSAKGLAHQANMETASILMSQIEYDLLRANQIITPHVKEKKREAEWTFFYKASDGSGKLAKIKYTSESRGIKREIFDIQSGKSIQSSYFAKDQNSDISFVHVVTNTGSDKFYQLKQEMWVELTISSKNKKTATAEPFTMKRLITVRSQL